MQSHGSNCSNEVIQPKSKSCAKKRRIPLPEFQFPLLSSNYTWRMNNSLSFTIDVFLKIKCDKKTHRTFLSIVSAVMLTTFHTWFVCYVARLAPSHTYIYHPTFGSCRAAQVSGKIYADTIASARIARSAFQELEHKKRLPDHTFPHVWRDV